MKQTWTQSWNEYLAIVLLCWNLITCVIIRNFIAFLISLCKRCVSWHDSQMTWDVQSPESNSMSYNQPWYCQDITDCVVKQHTYPTLTIYVHEFYKHNNLWDTYRIKLECTCPTFFNSNLVTLLNFFF